MLNIPHLETDITTACQLSCVSCNHLVPLWREHGVWRADPDQVRRDLTRLATIMHAHAWGALGGEPLLHPNLMQILSIVRASGISDRIEVWTNGLLLHKMKDDFWYSDCIDEIVLSVYEGKHTEESLDWIIRRCDLAEYKLRILDERNWHNFRTNLESEPTSPLVTKAKFDGCFFRQFSRVANRGYFYTCCCAPHQPVLLQDRAEGADGVLIEGLTEEGLRNYLERSEPLGCCSMCAGRDTAKPIQWSEERDPSKWIMKSAGLNATPD